MSEAVAQSCSVKNLLLEIWPQACNFIKMETLTQVFSCEFCEISKNTFLVEQLQWLLLQVNILDKIKMTKVSILIYVICQSAIFAYVFGWRKRNITNG